MLGAPRCLKVRVTQQMTCTPLRINADGYCIIFCAFGYYCCVRTAYLVSYPVSPALIVPSTWIVRQASKCHGIRLEAAFSKWVLSPLPDCSYLCLDTTKTVCRSQLLLYSRSKSTTTACNGRAAGGALFTAIPLRYKQYINANKQNVFFSRIQRRIIL